MPQHHQNQTHAAVQHGMQHIIQLDATESYLTAVACTVKNGGGFLEFPTSPCMKQLPAVHNVKNMIDHTEATTCQTLLETLSAMQSPQLLQSLTSANMAQFSSQPLPKDLLGCESALKSGSQLLA